MTTAALDLVQENFKKSGFTGLKAVSTRVDPKAPTTTFAIRKRSRRKPSWKTLAGLMAIAIAAGSISYKPWKLLPAASVSVAGESTAAPRTVTVDRPSTASTATVVLPATIRPWQTATLFARVNGYLHSWRQELGAQVTAGELLAELETPELDQEVAQGEAQVREATTAMIQARAEREEAQADLKVAEAQLVRVQAEAELARSQLIRREKLLASRAVSQEEYETAQRQLESRTADVAATESEIGRRRANLGTRAAIIDSREATVNTRQANVDRLKELQRFKRIVAPFDGVVTRRTAEVGMLVTAGTEPLFVVEDMSRVRVQIKVPQTYAVQTREGVAANISLPESVLPAVRATITRIADSVDATSRTMLAEVELENAASHFQPGSYAQVTLTTSQAGDSWTIPANTLAMRVAGPHVALVNEQNQIEMKRVRLGRNLGTRVVVIDGIRGDERLVVNPGDDLVDGVQIQFSRGENRSESAHEIVQR